MSKQLDNLPELQEYFIKNLLIVDDKSDKNDSESDAAKNLNQDGLTVGYNVYQNEENPLLYKIDFQVIIKDGDQGEAKCAAFIEGYFSFDEQSDSETRDYLIRLQGCTTLYGILRGILSSITSMTRSRKILLPNIMMQEVVKDIEEGRQREESEDKSSTEE